MAVLAMIYGIASKHGIWYPIKPLGSRLSSRQETRTAQIAAFHWDALIIAAASTWSLL